MKETGGPAFGSVISLECVRLEMDGSAEYEPKAHPGNLTVRDYFAAKAMEAFIVKSDGTDAAIIPAVAYKVADAMLKAREK